MLPSNKRQEMIKKIEKNVPISLDYTLFQPKQRLFPDSSILFNQPFDM